jgi:import inner membrane translocase subunit TIM54
VPRRVLNAKPRLPSRNWSIFLGIVGSISYLYYDDRKRADKIRNEYIDKVKFLAEQPTVNALEQLRKVKVYGARWPEDDESDRALRYFRKYVKVS